MPHGSGCGGPCCPRPAGQEMSPETDHGFLELPPDWEVLLVDDDIKLQHAGYAVCMATAHCTLRLCMEE